MKISQLIKHLKETKDLHGDLEVYQFFFGNHRKINPKNIQIANLKIKEGRETKQRIWSDYHGLKLKGEKVLTI